MKINKKLTILMFGLLYIQTAHADPVGSIQNLTDYLVTSLKAGATIPWCFAGWHYYFGKGDKAKSHVGNAIIGSVIAFGVAGIVTVLRGRIQ